MRNESTYIIGEIGQNHNGSTDLAKLLVDLASRPIHDDLFGTELKPIDAIKLTKRDLNYELSQTAMNRKYDSIHSFGDTYGEHRAYLELSNEEHCEVFEHAKTRGLDFVITLCAPSCLSVLKLFKPDKLKVASRDLTNIPLIEALAETRIPIILSTGMSGIEELDLALESITKKHDQITILHCLSQYPSQYENINLRSINFLKKRYPIYSIGYSDHSIGIFIPTAAVAMGATYIEKHITIDRDMKGTDQKGSLGPDGLRRMVRDIRLLERSLGLEEVFKSDVTKVASAKLERSWASRVPLKAGHRIREEDLHLLSPGDGYKYSDKTIILEQVLNTDLDRDEIIYSHHLS